ncbi:putative tetratricopeptide-like helical domain superfamily [Helianthus debilis subsp. tardiflorus]
MSKSSLRLDNFSLGTVLHACSVMATLGHGKMIHSLAIVHGFHCYAYVGNGLVNMYAKCGDIDGSKQSFNDIMEKDLVSWNTMLIAYGLHGWGGKALKIYEEMLASGLKPDKGDLYKPANDL